MSPSGFLLDTGDLDGPLNMAIDELLWQAAAAGSPFLRLYGWSDPPVLSLGYFQSSQEVRSIAAWRGIPYVRRMTGGGAIVHGHDLTYSLALPAAEAPATEQLYRRFHALVAAELRGLGIAAEVAAFEGGADFLCFRRRDRHAVCVGPYKVLGSAQRRRPDAVLMQGSLALASSPLAPDEPGIAEITGRAFERRHGREAMLRAAQAAVGRDLHVGDLPDGVRRAAERLAAEKYRSPKWNDRR